MKARILILLGLVSLHAAQAEGEAPATGKLAPKLEKLSEQEIGEWLWPGRENSSFGKEIARRGLISDAVTIRIHAAKQLVENGAWEDVPWLIDSLSDESINGNAQTSYAGMATTRYWANVALIGICKTDFGYRWDEPLEKRKEAIGRWTDYWKGLPKQHFGPGISWLHIDYPAHFSTDPRSHRGEAKWWAKFDSPDTAAPISIEVSSYGYVSQFEMEEKKYPSAAAYFRAEIAPKDSEVKAYPGRYHRYLSKTADSVTAYYLYDIAEQMEDGGRCYLALSFHFKGGEQARHQTLIDEVLLSAKPGGEENEEAEK